ncbi:uncharacterized protein LOC124352541 [Daphnia pulicaria]|uniref:uncharacterized protein LOC124352541 n=1 Tax=Daphnia pulicaria TaxID=35523 RepID=UPI001EEB357E|nr:uncharacterized protein LOC124352541 [Daphnia pulicaria]
MEQKALVFPSVLVVLLVVAIAPTLVVGHGMMLSPPQRSSMFRLGFKVPPNYNDNGLNCGGFGVQYNDINKGRCGECGDEWSLPRPRPNDEGGQYGTGIKGKTYYQGSIIDITVNISSNHKGYFEFRLCPKSSASELVTQECLNANLLKMTDDTTRFYLPSQESKPYFPRVKLPAGLICENCVLQWLYNTGNSWGVCANGTGALGCGNQETFVNCADISILP